jgi:hypothetical protein
MRPGRIAPHHSSRPAPSLITVGLIVFCLRLPDTNARRPGRFAFAPADLHLGPVDTQLHTLSGGVGEHIGHSLQP